MRKAISRIAAFAAAATMVFGMMAVPAAAEGTPISICIITSTGIDDGSFNQDCYVGIKNFIAEHPDCSVTDIKESDYAQLIPTVEKSVGDYDVFVLPGYNFVGIGDIVKANPDKFFIVVDAEEITDGEGNKVPAAEVGNVYTMTFREEESGFLAGVAAALASSTGKVAVVNGMAFPSNVNYEYGFMSGVNFANAKYGSTTEYVELPSYAGTDLAGENVGGNYTGDFNDVATGKVLGEALLAEGCDIIFPAAGVSGNGVFTAVKEAENAYCIGCDVDQYDDGVSGDRNIILTSVLKLMHENVEVQLNNIYDGTFVGEDAILGMTSEPVGTGYVSEPGRQQLDDGIIEKLNECEELLKSGAVTPASGKNDYKPDDFPGLA